VGLLSARAFSARFKDLFLRRAVPQMFAWPEIPMIAALPLLAYIYTGNAGFPAGASLEFSRSIERRYRQLGGEIHYKSEVEQILVEDAPDGSGQRTVGVRLYSDDEHRLRLAVDHADYADDDPGHEQDPARPAQLIHGRAVG
jgi:phytoene dehydrogenase-like protein